MSRPQFSSRDVLKVLDKAGWEYAPNAGGSHIKMMKYDHSGEKYTVTVVAGQDPIPQATLHSIARQAGANDFGEFCDWIERER